MTVAPWSCALHRVASAHGSSRRASSTDFTCATLAWHRTLEGTFASEGMASGQERVDVSGTDEECDLVGNVPGAQVRTFEMNFID